MELIKNIILPEIGSLPVLNSDRIPVCRPLLPTFETYAQYLYEIDTTRIYSNFGPLVRELQRRFAHHLSLDDGWSILANSGTSALVALILAIAGRAPREKPLCLLPAYTFVGTAVAVQQAGYTPYFVDIDPQTWQIDPERLVGLDILNQVGLVVPVCAYGRSLNPEPWAQFQENTGIPVVIDAAAALEAIERKPDTMISAIPLALSLHATKSFGIGEGGLAVIRDCRMAEQCARALNFGFFKDRDSKADAVNGKLSELHAAVGLAELDNWSEKSSAWQAVAEYYRHTAAELGLGDMLFIAPVIASCYALYLASNEQEAANVCQVLTAAGIGHRFWYGLGLHCQTHFRDFPREALPITDSLAPRLIGLPASVDLDQASILEVLQVINTVRKK